MLKKPAGKLTEMPRNSTTVDCLRASRGWLRHLSKPASAGTGLEVPRDSVRVKMLILIRQLLRKKKKCRVIRREKPIALVLKQAEALADDWTGER
ncbi:MAG: hypothetical protein V4689_10695 [Verrucomicrobiota bacterium]